MLPQYSKKYNKGLLCSTDISLYILYKHVIKVKLLKPNNNNNIIQGYSKWLSGY